MCIVLGTVRERRLLIIFILRGTKMWLVRVSSVPEITSNVESLARLSSVPAVSLLWSWRQALSRVAFHGPHYIVFPWLASVYMRAPSKLIKFP